MSIEGEITLLSKGFYDNVAGHEQAHQARVLEFSVAVLQRFLESDPDEVIASVDKSRRCCRVALRCETKAYTVLSALTGVVLSVAVFVYMV